jgi:hypothetical protein
MDIFNRTTPVYKASFANAAAHTQPAASPNGLLGLIGSLFGSATPVYKTVDGRGANALASSSGLFGSLLSAPTPVYKTAPVATGELAAEDLGADGEDTPACALTSDEVVLL